MYSLTQQMEASPQGWIKINVDEATTKSVTVLAAVARDDNGIVIKVWSRTQHICSSPPSRSYCHPMDFATRKELKHGAIFFGSRETNLAAHAAAKFFL